jgi:hypothetical protein
LAAAFQPIPNAVAVELRAVGEEFALSGFPEFVRSGDGFCAAAPLKLDAEELTDIGAAGVAEALRRAASWSPVTHTEVPSDFVSQSC